MCVVVGWQLFQLVGTLFPCQPMYMWPSLAVFYMDTVRTLYFVDRGSVYYVHMYYSIHLSVWLALKWLMNAVPYLAARVVCQHP